MKKFFLSLIVCLLVVVMLAGCGSKPSAPATPAPPAGSETAAPEESKNDAVMLPGADSGLSLRPAEVAPTDDAARIAKLKEIVQLYIDKEGYTFTYDDTQNIFWGEFTIENEFGTCDVGISVYTDMIDIAVAPQNWLVPEENRDKVSVYTTMVNYAHFYSYFQMDYTDGWVSARSAQIIESALPTGDEIDTLLLMPIIMLEEYGNGLLTVGRDGTNPAEAFHAVVQQGESAGI